MSENKNEAGAKLDAALKKRREGITLFSIFGILFKKVLKFSRQLLRLETIKKLGSNETEKLTQKEHIPMENARSYDDY
ncbi:hypothetical protein [Vibrio harveyi]|uniref:hypothetical protein n=1 Tax=Vibrio harveyi TaxID=669 RepID=UPI003CF144AA